MLLSFDVRRNNFCKGVLVLEKVVFGKEISEVWNVFCRVVRFRRSCSGKSRHSCEDPQIRRERIR